MKKARIEIFGLDHQTLGLMVCLCVGNIFHVTGSRRAVDVDSARSFIIRRMRSQDPKSLT